MLSGTNRFTILNTSSTSPVVSISSVAKTQNDTKSKTRVVSVSMCPFEKDNRYCPNHPLTFLDGSRKNGVPCQNKHTLLPLCPNVRAKRECTASNPIPGNKSVKCPFFHPQEKDLVSDRHIFTGRQKTLGDCLSFDVKTTLGFVTNTKPAINQAANQPNQVSQVNSGIRSQTHVNAENTPKRAWDKPLIHRN